MPWARLPTPLRLLLLTALYSSTASAMPASRLFAREDTCGADRVSCKSELTDLFCCPKDYSCILLAGDTSAMCCPAGRNCDEVRPITCDLRGQDITKYPKAPVMTIITNLKLEQCGSNCCPFGYSCQDGSKCVLNKDQSSIPEGAEYPESSSKAPSGTAPTTTETASATAEPTSTSEPSKASEGNQEQDPEEDKKDDDSSGPATTSIVGGVVGGCIILLIIAVVVFLYFRRQKRREGGSGNEKGHHHHHFYGGGNSTSSSEASFGNIISEPIVQPNSYRADFILKTPSQKSQMTPQSQMMMTPGGSSSTTTGGSSTLLQKSQFSSGSTPQHQRQYSFSPTPTRVPQGPPRIRISIPNPFDSPNPSPNHQSAQLSSPIDDQSVHHGTVRLPPIRTMKASSHCSRRPGSPEQLQREPSCESINVFADPSDVVKPRHLTRGTTFTDLMDEADLRDVGRGKAYAPGTKPHVPGTTPRI